MAAVHLEPTLRLQLADGAVVDLGDTSALDAKVEAARLTLRRLDAAFFTVNGVISIVFLGFVLADVLL